MDIVARILFLVKEKGKSQKELADYIGVSQQVVTDWKSGKSESYKKYLPKIASFFEISIDELAGNEKKPAIGDDDELSEDEIKLIEQYRAASAELKAVYRRIAKEN